MPWAEFPVPLLADDLTAGWFAAALALEGVESVALERLPGLLNAPLRARFSYAPGVTPQLQSAVIKMGAAPAPSGTSLPVADREYLFYQHLGRHVPVAVPHVLQALAGSGGRFILVLEDLLLRPGIRPFETRDLELAVEALGRRLHPAYWGSPHLAQYSYLRDMAGFIERVETRLATGVPRLLERFGTTLAKPERTLVERLPGGFGHAARPLTGVPPTLCHHDLSGRNLFVQGAGPGREIIFIDWQLVQAVPGVRDLSFLVGCQGVGITAAQERALLQRYHAGLLAQGVSGYEFDRLVEDYRRSIICDFGRMAMTASNDAHPPAMEDQFRLQLSNRAGAVERWGLLDLL